MSVLVLAACRTPDPAVQRDATLDERPRLRVGTFNVHRFFDVVCESGRCEPDDYESLPAQAEFEARAVQIATAIRALDLDVIALQEIETQACLDAILAHTTDTLPYGALGEIGFAGSVDVAILSRTPLDAVIGHRDDNPLTLPDGRVTTFARELLEIRTRVNGASLALFAAHFRSKVDDDPARRLAEAGAARRIVESTVAAEPRILAILAGDLNDVPGSPPLAALEDDAGLDRLADDLPLADQATYRYGGRGQAIDHLLLAPNRSDARLPRSARVWQGSSSFGYGGSDHAALTAELAIEP